ncbi:hypothetical protein SAMN02746065_10358 [Desulfocicer vacuolatum DSM 3385]|uniref:Uncharacterized protein n=1 Tax=Desulfocicer vacuolatum DSM 3385 TaxID=1121400 RepID=A0A1W1ZNJ7_9BACT|nr:hypothetical protein [Desulfocicer vacuolatum]SMC49966.1 hypothetical protein SAMN02746065_10358 [Desulfocicer vacuolatum DSM 3385]
MQIYNFQKVTVLLILLTAGMVWSIVGELTAEASDITDMFNEKYISLVPAPNSSVGSDYLFEQMALGSEYTIRILDLIYDQNKILMEKYDQILGKYDRMEAQNNEIIFLLKKIVEK